jgi:C_GCAxxG_C_C family probable redox protein
MSKVEQAVNCFNQGFSCSQAIASVYGLEYGIDRETLLKISSGFGAGMARLAECCGACTGAFMVLGLKYGRTRAEDNAAKEKTYALVQEFVRRFKGRRGSIFCRELLGADMSTAEGLKTALEKNLPHTVCPQLSRDAAEILEELL